MGTLRGFTWGVMSCSGAHQPIDPLRRPVSTSGAGGGPTIGDFGTTDAELQVDQRRDLGVAFAFIEELEPLDAFVLVAGLHHGHSADQTAALASERFGRSLSVDAVRQRRSQLRRTLASHILQKRRSHDAVGV